MQISKMFDDADDVSSIAYDEYRFTPYTDPTAVDSLWTEHFRRKWGRNAHVTQAFENKCAIFKFMYPELSRAEIVGKVLEQIGLMININPNALKSCENLCNRDDNQKKEARQSKPLENSCDGQENDCIKVKKIKTKKIKSNLIEDRGNNSEGCTRPKLTISKVIKSKVQ